MLSYYVIDIESTGLKAGWHEINQISIIRCSDKEQRTANIKVEYPHRADSRALEIQGKTKQDLLIGGSKTEAIELIDSFLDEDGLTPAHRCMIGHSVSFDRNHVHALWFGLKKNFKADLWLCTKEFSRRFAKKKGILKPKLTLAASCNMAGVIVKEGAHNAIVDTQNTYELYQILVNENLNPISLIKSLPHQY